MTFIPANDSTIPFYGMDGTVLQASTTITTSTPSTGVEVGKGNYTIDLDITAIHQESGFDAVVFWIEVNTKAATSTYEQIAALPVGDATGTGIAIGTTGVGTFPITVYNPRDNAIRINAKILGSTDSVTYSARIYPQRRRVVS
jgi:hypothetical protein